MSKHLVALVVACSWTGVLAFAPGPALSSRCEPGRRPAAGVTRLRMNSGEKPVVVVAGATGRVRTRRRTRAAVDIAPPV